MTEIKILSLYDVEQEGSLTEPITHIMKIRLIEECTLDVPPELFVEIIRREYKLPLQHCRYRAIIKNSNKGILVSFSYITIEELKSAIQKVYDELKNNY